MIVFHKLFNYELVLLSHDHRCLTNEIIEVALSSNISSYSSFSPQKCSFIIAKRTVFVVKSFSKMFSNSRVRQRAEAAP